MPFAEKAKAPPKAILALYGKDFEGWHSTLIVKAPVPSAGPLPSTANIGRAP